MPHRTNLPLLRTAALVAIIAGAAVAVPVAATDRVVVVQAGDTLSEIALKHGLTVAQLRDLNGIADPDRIYAGQRLRVSGMAASATPAPAARPTEVVHVVARGETLTGIARRYGSTIAGIVKANGIRNPSFLRVGQRLRIPGAASTHAAKPAAPAARAAAPRMHVVARGETLTGIARHYGSTIAGIVKANGIRNPSFLHVGQRLTIPHAPATAPADKMPASISSLMAARGAIAAIIRTEAKSQHVPVALALAVAWQESGWRPRVVSAAGAIGVMQLTPPTAEWIAITMLGHRVDLRDARSNVQAGVTLLRHYLDRYHGNRRLTLAAYYQGQTAADRHGMYRLTRPYIASILALEKLLGG